MEQARIAALLEKYWQAETTVEEERQLADYFRQSSLPPEWEPLRNVFAFFEAEVQVTPGKEFEEKLLERIRQIGESGTDLSGGAGSIRGTSVPVRPAPIRHFSRRTAWWAAAAVIVLSVGISRLQGPGPTLTPAHPIVQTDPASPTTQVATIKDTYEDPHQALAAIQKALHRVSAKMNQGKTLAQKQMDRMNDGWQSALTN